MSDLLAACRAGAAPPPYGLTLAPLAAAEGWRVVGLRHRRPAENRDGHHLVIAIEAARGTVGVRWEGGEAAVPLRRGERASFPMVRGRRYGVWVTDGPSEGVAGFHTSHPDEAPGNRLFHHSFEITFAPPAIPTGATDTTASTERGTLVVRLAGGAGQTVLVGWPGRLVPLPLVLAGDEWRWEGAPVGSYTIALPGEPPQQLTLQAGAAQTVDLVGARAAPRTAPRPGGYLLLLGTPDDPATMQALLAAQAVIASGRVVAGFSVEEAARVGRVALLGPPGTARDRAEALLRAAGAEILHLARAEWQTLQSDLAVWALLVGTR